MVVCVLVFVLLLVLHIISTMQAYKYEDCLLINPGSATGAYGSITQEAGPSFVLMDISDKKVDDIHSIEALTNQEMTGWHDPEYQLQSSLQATTLTFIH